MTTPLRVDTNCVELKIKDFAYHQYDVMQSARPGAKDPSPKMKDLLLHHLQNVVQPDVFTPRLIYDRQKIAYCRQPLQFGSGNAATFHVCLKSAQLVPAGSKGSYQITLSTTIGSVVSKQDLSTWMGQPFYSNNPEVRARGEAARNLVQLIMRQEPNKHHRVKNGRAYFSNAQGDFQPTKRGIDFWRGIFLSVRTNPERLMLQVDTTTTAVYRKGELTALCLDFLFGDRRGPPPNLRDLEFQRHDPNLKRLEKVLSGVRVTIKIGSDDRGVSKVIRYLEPEGGNFQFEKDGQPMTVAEYYARTYNVHIRNKRVFGVSLEKRGSTRQTIVPAELCMVVEGQICNRLPDELRSEMVRFSVLNPGPRKDRIQRELHQTYLRSEYLVEAGVMLGDHLIPVEAKRLQMPQVMYKDNPADVKPNGSWNVTRSRFLETNTLNAWGVLNTIPLQHSPASVQGYMAELVECCRKLGMSVNPNPVDYQATSGISQHMIEAALEKILEKALANGQIKSNKELMIFVLLDENAAMPRAFVKHWGDITRGVLTQCLKRKKFDSKKPGQNNQYWNNVAIKMNARLGGLNSRTNSPFWNQVQGIGPFMVMGADVSHPSPGQQRPSVAGFVYSWDRQASKYAALTELQQPRQEAIQGLGRFVATAIRNFVRANNPAVPGNIIFFRDGLSEGEYLRVAGMELAEMQNGIAQIWRKANETRPLPKVTFVIVTKRHHAVFFPPGNNNNPKDNCAPGLVVEKSVTTHILPNFYLQSHSAIIGTSRSSHYLVLQNEVFGNHLERLQHFAHHLCYNYAKATRSVSIPSPVYYADLVCSRMMFHMNLAQMPDEDASTTSSGNTPFDLTPWQSSFQQLHPNMESNMYFL